MAQRINCWEFKKCGREPGGAKVAALGVCPAAVDESCDGLNEGKNGGRICWAVVGTFCGGKVQGTFAQKIPACAACDFLQRVEEDEGPQFLSLNPGHRIRDVLRASDTRYRDMVDGVPVALYRATATGQFIDVNQSLVRMLGYHDREELLGLKTADLYVDPETETRWTAVMAERGMIPHFEAQFRRRDGEVIWVNHAARGVKDDQGRLQYIEGSLEDISERLQIETELLQYQDRLEAKAVTEQELSRQLKEELRQAEIRERELAEARAAAEAANERLLASERKYREILSGSLVGIYRMTFDGEVVEANPSLLNTLGLESVEQMNEVGLINLYVEPKDSQRLVSMVLQGPVSNFETRLRCTDGRVVPVALSAHMVTDEQGNLQFMEGTFEDITERVQAEDALRESERRLADIINFLPDATFCIDHEGKVTAWNRAAEELVGVKAEDILGKGNYEYAIPFYGERRPILIDLVLLPQKEIKSKYSHLHREGDTLRGQGHITGLARGEFWMEGSATVLRDSEGKVVGAIETVRDMTARMQAEAKMQEAKEAAEAATQAKSSFLASMSHEIRTPMNAIIGMTSLLLDGELTREQRDFIETIRTSGDALLTIINDILDFSKIEAGRLELESQPFDVRGCVESALDLLGIRAREKGLELGCLVEAHTPVCVLGDVTRLRQIIVNLVGNAIKFTEKGEIVVSVTSRPLDATVEDSGTDIANRKSEIGNLVELEFAVRDTGIGIPDDRMDRLFKSFSQVDASTTRKYGGTGLGLAISKRLTDMMGGRMWVESEVGKGTTFRFTIRAETTTSVPPVYMMPDQPLLAGERLLIVDDNLTNLKIAALQVKPWGMEPVGVSSGREALELLHKGETFGLALLDMQMPEMDGLILAEEIRRLRDADSLPLVMLSSLGEKPQDPRMKHFAAYLNKPAKASQLYNTFQEVMARKKGHEAMSRPVERGEEKSEFDAEMGKRHPLRILLAEDNVINQKVALAVLERLGYRADVAANGEEAVQALTRQPYEVVLMDLQMPEMDGLEATRYIREKLPVATQPRIIAMTANAMQGDREMCLEAGMNDYVSKPIQVPDLVAALSKCQTSGVRVQEMMDVPESPPLTTGHSPPTTLAPDAPPQFDPAGLQQLVDTLGSQAKALLPTLIDAFYKEVPKLLAEARQALQEERVADLRRAAHTLKSNCANFGLTALAQVARNVEYLARDGTLDGAAGLIERITNELPKAVDALEEARKEFAK